MNKTDRRNTDTRNATQKRIENADDFAKEIVSILDDFEDEMNSAGFTFNSLGKRVLYLNQMGIGTIRGKKWTKCSISRVLKRVENMK